MTDVGLEDRGSLLDAFARAEPREQTIANLPVVNSPLPERVIGAQPVAIARDEKKILDKIKVIAAAAGSDWLYRFPVKRKDGGTEHIEGASIKLANDLARLYGNCEVETRVTDLGDSWLIYARFTDYESGFSMTRPFQQRKSQRGMRTVDDRALDIAFQIGASKAIRNVIVNSLQTFADFAFEEARNALVGKIGKDLDGWRTRTLEGLENKRIELARVERVIGRAAKDWTAPDVSKVIAMMRSIADGMTTIDETFPAIDSSANQGAEEKGGGQEQQTRTEETRHAARDVASSDSTTAPAAADRSPEEQAAYDRGKADRKKGMQKRAVPGELRDNNRLAIAWTRGWDDAGKS
jgi:hypothetical protein